MQQSVPADVRRDGATNPGLLGFTGATKTVPSESSGKRGSILWSDTAMLLDLFMDLLRFDDIL